MLMAVFLISAIKEGRIFICQKCLFLEKSMVQSLLVIKTYALWGE